MTNNNKSNNIKNENIKIFKGKIFNGPLDPFDFKKFLLGAKDKNNIPLIPIIYFNENFNDNIGANIINNYYSIKYKLRELRTIKKYIFTILEL